MVSDKMATAVIGVVTVMWVANIVAGIFKIQGYEPSESINGIFMTIVGGALVLRSKTKDGDDE